MEQSDQILYRSDLIRAAMAAQLLTNEAVAEMAGLSTETISRAKKGDNLSIETMRKIAVALRLEMVALFEPKKEAA
jgi:transcriptional regulator with XRE-family HTH domain